MMPYPGKQNSDFRHNLCFENTNETFIFQLKEAFNENNDLTQMLSTSIFKQLYFIFF